MHPNGVGNVAKERFSYPLRPELASAGTQDLAFDLAGRPRRKRPQNAVKPVD
jgi:hypothetical protein